MHIDIPVTGLRGAQGGASIPLAGGNGTSLVWDDKTVGQVEFNNATNASVSLHVHPNATIESGVLYQVAFQIVNPPYDQDELNIFISAGGNRPDIIYIRMPKVRMTLGTSPSRLGKTLGLIYYSRPMYVIKPSFIVRDIGQSTPIAGAVNRITVTFQTNVQISGDERQNITISGLSNAIADTALRLINLPDSFDAFQFFEYVPNSKVSVVIAASVHALNCCWHNCRYQSRVRYAYFDSDTLVLMMRRGMTFLLNHNYMFSFSCINPDQGQDAPNITIAGSGTATFLPEGAHLICGMRMQLSRAFATLFAVQLSTGGCLSSYATLTAGQRKCCGVAHCRFYTKIHQPIHPQPGPNQYHFNHHSDACLTPCSGQHKASCVGASCICSGHQWSGRKRNSKRHSADQRVRTRRVRKHRGVAWQ